MLAKLKWLGILALFLPTWTAALTAPFTVVVDPAWEHAQPKDVQAVLDSNILSIAPYIGNRHLDTVIIKNAEQGPISLYERDPSGDYVVLLDVNGNYWSQLTYQFSHEICHLLSNYDLAPNNVSKQQWFEESLCESFSLFTLSKMADQWEEHPPYPNWKDYAPDFRKYLDDMLKEPHRSLAPNLAAWYQENKATLEADPVAQERVLNEKIASHLLKIFSEHPESWAAINYINLGDDSKDKSLQRYLQDWYDNTPEPYRATVKEIQQQFGMTG